ncbi:MAG: hypothetical protein ABJ251_17430 [Paracoccaceae bacterium]
MSWNEGGPTRKPFAENFIRCCKFGSTFKKFRMNAALLARWSRHFKFNELAPGECASALANRPRKFAFAAKIWFPPISLKKSLFLALRIELLR